MLKSGDMVVVKELNGRKVGVVFRENDDSSSIILPDNPDEIVKAIQSKAENRPTKEIREGIYLIL